jgi:hypothetical protein
MSDKLALLTRLLEGNRDGLTRDQLAQRLNTNDREARLLISELTTLAFAPIICDRTTGEGRYRIAQAHEWDAINAECGEDASRAIKLHARATGRRRAFEKRYSAGDLFLRAIPDLEETAA